jgi:radical SAM protein with 4Fe4S-binding SPASM domain
MQTVPFSTRPREIFYGSLPDGYGYAFDFAYPSGVKVIPPNIFSRLASFRDSGLTLSGDKRLQAAAALIRHNPIPENSRLTVWLHVINGCNFACHYCYIPHLNRFVDRRTLEKHSLRNETIHPLLDNLLGYCAAERLSELQINFAGGEPTLNLPLVETFCREALAAKNSIKLTFGMISNGSFEADELIPLIERYKLRLSLSVDGYEHSHDRIRFELEGGSKRGSWEKLSENVRLLVDRKIIPYFLYTVTPTNYESIDDFADYAHDMGIGFRLSLVRAKTQPTHEAQVRIADKLIEFYYRLGETLNVKHPILRFAAFAEWNLYQRKYVPCSSCRKYFAIDAAGNVATCQMRMNHPYGNAVSRPLADIVADIRADPINVTMSKPGSRTGLCLQCQFFHVCASGCPQHNLLATGVMDRPSPWCHVYGTVLPHYIRAAARQLQRALRAHE